MNFCPDCGKVLNTQANGKCSNCIEVISNNLSTEEIEILSKQKSETPIAKLVVKKGGTEGREFPIYCNITNIGRWDPSRDSYPEIDLSDEDIDAKVSRKHARIIKKEEGFYIDDISSKNRTFLNREFKLVKGVQYPLKNNDEIIIGNIFFKFEILN